MPIRTFLLVGGWIGLALTSVIAPAGAAKIRQLYAFSCSGNSCPSGKMPVALLRSADGYFYGVTQLGGAANAGTVFRYAPDGQLATLYSFTDPGNGRWPTDLVEGADGALYGTTIAGGAEDAGVVFGLSKSGEFRLVHSLCNSCGEGADAEFLARGNDGIFYGGSYGKLFRVSPQGAFKVLHTFDLESEGPAALGLVQASNGDFYGTTLGAQSVLTVAFRLTSSGDFTPLQTFHYSQFATTPPIETSDGRLYGVLSVNDPNGDSAGRFRSNLSGSRFVIGTLQASPVDVPRYLMQASDGTLWGGLFGGNHYPQGALFNYSLGGKQRRAFVFNGANGEHPDSPLIELADGTLMGVTAEGGTAANGTTARGVIFSVR